MVPTLIISIVVRLAALAWSLVLVRRLRDWRMGFLSALLILMAARQGLTLHAHLTTGSALDHGPWSELPGLLVSFLVLIAVTLFGRVVLELQSSRENLQQVTRYYSTLLEKGMDVVYVTDVSGRIGYMSPSIVAHTGRPPSDYVGTNMRQWVHPEDQRAVLAAFDQALAQPSVRIPFAGRSSRADGSWRQLDAVMTNLLDDDVVRGIVVASRDVTERQQAMAVLRERETQLIQAEKLNALGTLAGGIAHDFNNLLGAIRGHTELALRAASGTPIDDNLREVLAAADRGSDLVRQVLLFGRCGDQPHRPLHLTTIVTDAARLIRAALPSSIRIHHDIDVATDRDVVEGDPDQLHRVLVNLCTNAGYAMREHGGSLEIGLAACKVTAARTCAVGSVHPQAYLRVRVRDTGTGIAPDLLPRIFEPFFTTKPRHEIGCGMGLAAIAGIVGAHRGAITVSSTPDQGTTFEVFLPRRDRIAVTTPLAVALPPSRSHEDAFPRGGREQ